MASSATSAHTQQEKTEKNIVFCNFQLKKHSATAVAAQKWDDKNGKYCTLAHTNYFLRFNQIRQECASGAMEERKKRAEWQPNKTKKKKRNSTHQRINVNVGLISTIAYHLNRIYSSCICTPSPFAVLLAATFDARCECENWRRKKHYGQNRI